MSTRANAKTVSREEVAAALADKLANLLSREFRRSVNVGDVFVQVAVLADDGDDADEFYGNHEFRAQADATPDGKPERSGQFAMLIEINGLGCPVGDGADWQPETDSFFNLGQQSKLEELGFRQPGDGLPLWRTELATGEDAGPVATRLVDALVDVCGIPVQVVAADLDFRRGPVNPLPRRRRAQSFAAQAGADEIVDDPAGLVWDYGAFVLSRRAEAAGRWPWSSDVAPAFFAIVDRVARTAVLDLLALAPLAPGAEDVGWFRRVHDGWIADPTVPRRLSRDQNARLRVISAETARTVERQLKF